MRSVRNHTLATQKWRNITLCQHKPWCLSSLLGLSNPNGNIYEFDPLIKLTFPNLIPIKPLKSNLISIGEGIKLLNN